MRSLPPPAVVLLAAVVLLTTLAAPVRADEPRWLWPVPAPHPVVAEFEQPQSRYGPGHRGIDVLAAADAPVRAVEGGTVRFSGAVAGRGVVSVLHGDGLISTYEPVRGTVAAGTRVRAGAVLGTLAPSSAASHCAPELCLHLGARRGERYLDPLLLLGVRGPSVLLPLEGGSREPALPASVPGRSGPSAALFRRGGGPGRGCGAACRR